MNDLLSIKKSFICRSLFVSIQSGFEPDWDPGDTPCPGSLALWLEAGPFTGCKRQLASHCKVALKLTVEVLVCCL